MRKFTREDKLRIMTGFRQSEAWDLYQSEIEQHIEHVKGRINSATESGDANRLFAAQSYRMALEFCLTLPAKVETENTNFFDRLYKKVVGAE